MPCSAGFVCGWTSRHDGLERGQASVPSFRTARRRGAYERSVHVIPGVAPEAVLPAHAIDFRGQPAWSAPGGGILALAAASGPGRASAGGHRGLHHQCRPSPEVSHRWRSLLPGSSSPSFRGSPPCLHPRSRAPAALADLLVRRSACRHSAGHRGLISPQLSCGALADGICRLHCTPTGWVTGSIICVRSTGERTGRGES